MSFWFIAAALVVVGTALVVWPLLRPRPDADPEARAIAVYRQQLDELDRDRARGLIDDEQMDAARIEIQRRILHAAKAGGRSPERLRTRPLVASLVALVLGAGSVGLYAWNGEPGVPGQPLAARDQTALLAERERLAAQLAELEERAATDPPAAAEFWFALGRLRLDLIGPAEAIRAFREGLGRNPDSVMLMAALGEALVQDAQGTVTPAAREVFRIALEREPQQPQALYFLGVAAVQEGDDATALARWGDLLASAPEDAPWREAVSEQFREAADRTGADADALLAERSTRIAGTADGPSGEQSDLSEAEREAMIRSMVDGLAARLDEDPNDVDGWLRLGRSRLVLGEAEGAIEAYARAAALAPDNPEALMGEAEARLAAAEKVQGVPVVSKPLSDLLQRVAELQPENPQPHWYLGLHALQQGDLAETREAWERVLALLGPENPSYGAVKEQIEALPGGG